MKLRLHDNSIRFRLTQREVERLVAEGRVESSLRFTAPDSELTYALETSSSYDEVNAQRNLNEIRVTLPEALARTWATTNQVTIEHLQSMGSDARLRILVEKDFRCVHRDETPEQDGVADLYPNPNDSVGSVE